MTSQRHYPVMRRQRQTIMLRSDVTPDSAPAVALSPQTSNTVRLELLLGKTESAKVSVTVTTGAGEVVHEVTELSVVEFRPH